MCSSQLGGKWAFRLMNPLLRAAILAGGGNLSKQLYSALTTRLVQRLAAAAVE
jgi:hypothetical protein